MANKEFTSVLMTKPRSNVFDLTHDVKFSCNMGELIPVMCKEVLPGDKWNCSAEMLVRFAPMLAPIMHKVNVFMHTFFVPSRILWENWEKFITNTQDSVSGDVPAFPVFTLDAAGTNYTRLCDYLGLPDPALNVATDNEVVSAMPPAGYQLICNEFYRDQNLMTDLVESGDIVLVDGDNTASAALFELRTRAWEHDYFTSCLPFAQKGVAVDLPLGDITLDPSFLPDGKVPIWVDGALLTPAAPGNLITALGPQGHTESTGAAGAVLGFDPKGSLVVDPTTLNDLRRAFGLQRWLEKNARGGTRYIEHLLVHFGVRSSDKRLQRPEFIYGDMNPVQISEVLQTSETTVNSPQGDMAGHGISVANSGRGHYFAEEHGFIYTIVSIMPKTAYYQGIERMWLKTVDFSQYFYPDFAHLGEQEVYNRELYAFTASGGGTFGYIPRYSEYKYAPSRVCGDFRTTLDFWHLGRRFAAQPALNQTFIECVPTTDIFAVTGEDIQHLWCHIFLKNKVVRLLPKFSVPGGL